MRLDRVDIRRERSALDANAIEKLNSGADERQEFVSV